MLDEIPIVEYESIIMRQAPTWLQPPSYEREDKALREVWGAAVVLVALLLGVGIGLQVAWGLTYG